MAQPCVRVAAIVVSEMKERLSPKNAPPTTMAVIMPVLTCVACASPVATGASATMVPTEVPTEREMKQDAMKTLASSRLSGRRRSVSCTVASIAPISLADWANAPASTKIQIIIRIFRLATPEENRSTRSAMLFPRVMSTAQTAAAVKATVTGTA